MSMSWDLAAMRAALSPGRPALYWQRRWFSYAELNERACRLAAALAQKGVGKGDRIGILAFNDIAHIDLLLAAPKLGCIYTPFNYRLSVSEQADLCEYLRPALVIGEAGLLGPATQAGIPTLELSGYEEWLADAPAKAPTAPEICADDVHMILFTGGSTGLPKGVMIPYRQVCANAVDTALCWGVTREDCVIQATPAFHAAINVLTTPLFYLGGRVVLMRSFEADAYLRLLQKQNATLLFMVPTMYHMLVEHPEFDEADLGSVRWAISGGAPCPQGLRGRFADRGIGFRQGYGLTEAGVNCFTIEQDEADAHPDAVGRPMWQLEAVIRKEDGGAVEPGEVGELTLRGPQISLGYFDKPGETAELIRDGWLWTGDLARQDENGLFHITGRRKEMYISGGENIYPNEIEAALYEHPDVEECAVMAVPDERWGEAGLAAVQLRSGARQDNEALRVHLRSRLAAYKVPAHFMFLEELPRTGAGKIAKPRIRELFESSQEAETAS